jgi:hypothetical protein
MVGAFQNSLSGQGRTVIGFVGKPNFATVISRKIKAPRESQPLCRLHSMQRSPAQCIAAEEVMTKLTLPHERQGRYVISTASRATPVLGVVLNASVDSPHSSSPLRVGKGIIVALTGWLQ